jgi:hemerythrin
MTAPVIDYKYRIGIDEMDAQHAVWIQLIEKFRAVAAEHINDQQGLDAAREALEALLDYTRSHFASEERFIAEHHYPGQENHKRHHREIEAAVVKLLGEISQEHVHTPLKLNLFITVWLLEHIMQEDWDYARYITRKRPAATS